MKDGYKVKICGTTSLEDALLAAGKGADYFGVVVEVDFSPRSLTVEQAKDIFDNAPVPAVALVYNMDGQRLDYLIHHLKPFGLQFLNQEEIVSIERLKKQYPQVQIWQSIHLPSAGAETVDFNNTRMLVQRYLDAGVDLLLYDTVATLGGKQKFGGTGLVSDWDMVKKLIDDINTEVPVLLAGGINPENVSHALEYLDPDGVDLCSGVEAEPGKKDRVKVENLMNAVKALNRR